MGRQFETAVAVALTWVVAAGGALPEGGAEKVDPALAGQFAASADGRAPFLVVLQEQADLSPAARLLTKQEKGRFVYAALRAAAARTQQPVVDLLAHDGAACHPFWIVNAVWSRGRASAATQAAQRSDVRGVLADRVAVQPLPVPDAVQPLSTLGVEWGVSMIRAPDVWALGYTGQGVVVGGQDTGYAWDHPALKHAYRGWDGTNADHNFNWHDAIHAAVTNGSESAAPWDDLGHGTHTMGTMVGADGANQIGVAPGARWIGCRNMAYNVGTYARYLECFEWFLAPTDLVGGNPDPTRAPDVMNNSWVFTSGEGCTNVDMLKPAVEACRAAGIVVVASAGNSGPSAGSVVNPPALYAASFTVGSVDSSGTIAGTSSRGPVTADGSGRRKPDVCAPGVGVRSSVPGGSYETKSGTSMAGPHVAGAVALILSAHPTLRGQVDRIETLLERTAQPHSPAPDNTYGWGRIDVLAAVGLTDSDGDGIPDWWENIHGLNPTNALDAASDSDGDGMSNRDEWICNTDPNNRASVLRIEQVSISPEGAATIVWRSRQDGFTEPRLYDVLAGETLVQNPAAWQVVRSNVPSAGDWTSLVIPFETNTPARLFYRIRVSTAAGQALSLAAARSAPKQ